MFGALSSLFGPAVPQGAVVAFESKKCPAGGWVEYKLAHGRFIRGPNEVRLLRHNKGISSVWRQRGRKAFGCSASFQKPRSPAYKNRPYACHFLWEKEKLPDGDFTGLFVGITKVSPGRKWDGEECPAISHEETVAQMRDDPDKDWEIFDLEWLEDGKEQVGSMLIRWGNRASTRAWSQCADQKPKEIVELRRRAGFSDREGAMTTVSGVDPSVDRL